MKRTIFNIILAMFVITGNAQDTHLVDAAFALNSNIVYFIKGDIVVKYDYDNDKVLETDRLSNNVFPGVTFKIIDAAINYNGNKAYFFSGNYYTRFDLTNFKADAGYPKHNNVWNMSFTSLDAALNWTEKAYFFKGSQYTRYSKNKDKEDAGYPNQTSTVSWPGLTYQTIDAALSMPNGKSYFFKGSEYIRFDQKTDKADEGYPKTFAAWPGLKEAIQGKNNQNITNNKNTITKHLINLEPEIIDPSSILCSHLIKPSHDGGFYLAYPSKSNIYVQKFNKNIKKEGSTKVFKDYWFSDFYPMKNGSVIFLLGRSVNNTYLEGYPNSLYFVKMNSDGYINSPKLIFGENKHTAGESWFDGRSKAKIHFNGSEFGIYFEVQKNWANQGEKDDIHNGDMFVVTDLDGNLKVNREHFWTASHSSTINLSAQKNGDFYTLTIGDAHPFGLQLYNRNTKFNTVVWPPKEDHIPYEKCNSANAAGLLEYMDVNGGDIIAILATLEKPNIGVFDKVDPLFLKFDTKGNIKKEVWLNRSPNSDESKISTAKTKNGNYIIAWSAGNVYENNYKPDNITISVIDSNGNFIKKSKTLNYPFGTYSKIIALTDGRVVWTNAGSSPSGEIEIFVGKVD